MNSRRVLVSVAAVMLMAACGGGDGEGGAEGTASPYTGIAPPAGTDAPATVPGAAPGSVDTAGMGTNPPTAGGQIVDTAAVPGPTDTAQGTTTAP